MIKVGITGGIGSGKTTVSKVFELLDIPVYYADDEAKNILNENDVVKKEVIKIFGTEILENTIINRQKLAALVFASTEKLDKLNSIIHPAVAKHFQEWVKLQKSKYIIKEAAILFESGANKQVDKVITVSAPIDLRIKRVCSRDNVSETDVLKRINSQMTDEQRENLSDFIIINDENTLVIPQVLAIHQKIIS